MFKPVTPKLNVTSLEEAILYFWKEKDIFHRTMKEREGGPEYVFYEGPPTANGKPGCHHVLARAFKDLFPRYKTMRGYHVLRRGGWDTHGLPVEIEVEKKLGFTKKSQIDEYGIAKFNELCRQSAFSNIQDWEKLTERIAFWVDLKDAYVTYTTEYIESVWHILQDFWKKNLLYQGYKVVPYCPRCGTPLSMHEVSQGYKDTEDPSVFVRMPLVDEPGTSLLVWTTTPWTLPANVAVAAGEDIDYVIVETALPENGSERLILAETLLGKVIGETSFKVIQRFKGKQLKGKRYHPLFTFLPFEKKAHYVLMADFVSVEDGTGLVHMAPAYGADDMKMAGEYDLPVLQTVAPDGTFITEVKPWAGKFVKDADPLIIQDLHDRGLLFKSELYPHSYPFCWRCESPLLYFARLTWFIRTSRFKDRLVALNNTINWYPSHIKNGRFGDFLDDNIDWALGRERYWGTPLPVWECTSCHHQTCIGSVSELEEKSGKNLEQLDLHRPFVDDVHLHCEKCGGMMNRVPELIDVWFDSGSMPVAQWHYPFEHEKDFEAQFPADYICEAVDQTRGWFYSLHAISSLLFDEVCYKNVICLGLILDENGQKMSKHKGNVVDPWPVINQNGADAMRWYLYTASPPGQERRFSSNLVGEVVRNFTLTLWNTYSFFVTYANLDEWKPNSEEEASYSDLDKWLRSELHALIRDVTDAYEVYDVLAATRPVEAFVDKLSNWYLRRSRRRFWKSGSDADKKAAYATLYEVLATVAKLLAPAMPFLSEEIYQNLVCRLDREAPDSIHLASWPEYDSGLIDEKLNREMATVMHLASLGHAVRNKANRKVRQPLAEAAFSAGSLDELAAVSNFAELLEDELNVKTVRALSSATEAVSYSLNPYPKQLGQKYGARFPAIRQALLSMDPVETGRTLLGGERVSVVVDGETLAILPEEVEVRVTAREGLAVAAEGAYLAALVTELSPELIREGLAREFVRRVQDLRKSAEFDIADRIDVFYRASDLLKDSIVANREFIMGEVLARELADADAPVGTPKAEDEFDGENLLVGIKRVQ